MKQRNKKGEKGVGSLLDLEEESNKSIYLYSCVFIYQYDPDLKGSLAMVASEASLVVDLIISSKLIHQIHSLLTRLALLSSACEGRHIKTQKY